MNILFLSRWYPWPVNNGSRLRVFNLLRLLADAHQVTLLSFSDEPVDHAIPSPLHDICHIIETVLRKPYDPTSRRALQGLFSLTPRSVVDTFSADMAARIKQTLANGDFDLIIASEWEMGAYNRYFDATPALFEEVEVGLFHQKFVDADSLLKKIRYGLSWFKHRQYIRHLLQNFAACTVVSEEEKTLLSEIAPRGTQIQLLPNCVTLDADFILPPKQPDTLIFTGSFRYRPNYEAMVWFLAQVFPHIVVERPLVKLTITGDHDNLPLPTVPNVHLAGFVDDIQREIAAATISIVPLHSGGGTRLKILEALALKTAVVSTPKGAEGLAVENGRHLLIAEQPQAFAAAIMQLLDDEGLRRRLAENGRRLIAQKYDWDVVQPQLLALVETITQSYPSPRAAADKEMVSA